MLLLETKQVIVVRKDLNMRKGKLAAQVAHASMKVLLDRMVKTPERWCLAMDADAAITDWLQGRFTKVVVSVDSEAHLYALAEAAAAAGLPHALIQDAGLTEFKGPTYTALAVGPASVADINAITGELSLL